MDVAESIKKIQVLRSNISVFYYLLDRKSFMLSQHKHAKTKKRGKEGATIFYKILQPSEFLMLGVTFYSQTKTNIFFGLQMFYNVNLFIEL